MNMGRIIAFVLAAVLCAFADEYPKLVAEWDFSKPDVLTAGPFPLKLRKGAKVEDGLLNSQPTELNVPGGATTYKIHPELDMKGAFSVLAEFEVDDMKAVHYKMLFDNKYNYTDTPAGGFMLALRTLGNDLYCPFASFGFGANCPVLGTTVKLEKGKRHTLRMLFTGLGSVQFFVNGQGAGQGKVMLGSIAKARHVACVGDRYSSTCCHFGKGIAKLAIYEERSVLFTVYANALYRKAFERGEKKATLHYVVFNNSGEDLRNAKLTLQNNDEMTTVTIDELKKGETLDQEIPLDTLLLPGRYEVHGTLCSSDGKELWSGEMPYFIAPKYGDFLPVALTGWGKPEKVKEFGFTHFRSTGSLVPSRNGINEANRIKMNEGLDAALAHGLYQVFYIRPVSFFGKSKEDAKYLRKNRNGELYPNNPLDVSNPELVREICALTEQCAKEVGEHPGWDLAVINSEVRDSMQPAFGGVEEENFRKYAGFPVPREVTGKYPESYKGNPNFSWEHVLPENDKLLTYYRWLWGNGDGWNNVHSLVSDIAHKYLTHHHTTFFEPAVRNPPQWGSGGRTDTISQWTYTNPDPIKINQAFDELRAMADEHEHQEIFKETQIIWYRNQTAPIGEKPANMPDWVEREPDAKYITIPPDCLREAIWCDISHRVQCLMFHGSGCLFPDEPTSSYRYTNPDTKFAFKEMALNVLRPLGPVIKLIPERLPEVAILESFTSSIYAPEHATSGWSKGWAADLHLALQWAHIQPSVIYEEHLLTGRKMENVKVILLPGGEVLGEDVLKKLKELQHKGVILVGDEYTLPALMPDVRIESVKRLINPQETKEKLQKLGLEIAALLKGHYDSPITATDQDIILRRRGTDDADYLFIANDKRVFGDYLGPWKRVMEKGVQTTGTVGIDHPVKAAYDLVRHSPLEFTKTGKGISFDVDLAPGDGRMLLLLKNQRIASVTLKLAATELVRKSTFSIECAVLDEKGGVIQAVVPLEVSLLDANGNPLPGTGFYAAQNGRLVVQDVLAPNMSLGKVTVTVKELASGKEAQATFVVQ
ncbi:MAG: hypothetical protein IKP00_15480 [Victivallales bacterium]|nr:hypothetical protein [Victivallales bacterium]